MEEQPTIHYIKNIKTQYELIFIICIITYALFSLGDILFWGANAIQWEVLWNGRDFIADFTNIVGYSAENDPYNNTVAFGVHEKIYPPLQYFVSYLISGNISNLDYYYKVNSFSSLYTDTRIMMLFIIFTVISIIGIYSCVHTFKNGSSLTKHLAAISVCLSFPIVYTIERGNSINSVLAFILFYLVFNSSNNKILKEFSFISIALAASLKISPAFLGVILIIEKRWKDAIKTIVYGIVFFFGPFLLTKGGFTNIPLLIRNLLINIDVYEFESGCTIKGFFMHYMPEFFFYNFDTLNTLCSITTVIICVLLLSAAFLSKSSYDRILFVCLIMIILPSHSGTYCVIYIIPAILAMLNESGKRRLDKYILLGGCLCMCRLGGIIGYICINHHNGLLIILLCSIVRATEIIISYFTHYKTKQTMNLVF